MECEICLRESPLTKHHLVPVSRHKKAKKRHSKEKLQEVIRVCRQCHSQLHALISEKEMDEKYNSLSSLLEHDGVAKFTGWIRKRQPNSQIRVISSRTHRRFR